MKQYIQTKRSNDPPESKEYKKRSWIKDLTTIITAVLLTGGGTSYYWYTPDDSDAVLQKCVTDLQLEIYKLNDKLGDLEEKIDVLLQR